MQRTPNTLLHDHIDLESQHDTQRPLATHFVPSISILAGPQLLRAWLTQAKLPI
jgi:hypothetical protein